MKSTFSQQQIIAIAVGVFIGLILGTIFFNVGAGIGFAIFGGAIGYAFTLYRANAK